MCYFCFDIQDLLGKCQSLVHLVTSNLQLKR